MKESRPVLSGLRRTSSTPRRWRSTTRSLTASRSTTPRGAPGPAGGRESPARSEGLLWLDGRDAGRSLAFAARPPAPTARRSRSQAARRLHLHAVLQVRTDLPREADRDAVAWVHQSHVDGRVEGGARRPAAGGKSVGSSASAARIPRPRSMRRGRRVAGVHVTSNIAAYARWGITSTGTMDHFAIQAAERPGAAGRDRARLLRRVPEDLRRRAHHDADRHVRHGARHPPCGWKPRTASSARSASTPTSPRVRRPRAISLKELGAPHTKIHPDGLDEGRVEEPARSVDGFASARTSSAAPTRVVGVGAVAARRETATRHADEDLPARRAPGGATTITIRRVHEEPPGDGARAMLSPVVAEAAPRQHRRPRRPRSVRGRAKEEMDALSPEFRAIAKGEASN